MSIFSGLTRIPRPYDRDRAQDISDRIAWASGDLLDLLRGTGGSSPYLHALLLREHEWLQGAVNDPDASVDAEFASCQTAESPNMATQLRQSKRRLALITALCDLGGVWPLAKVTGTLTRFADISVQSALRAALLPELTRGKIPGKSEADLDQAGGMCVLAMGKMGAYELNYSSDIDLICLFDETQFGKDDIFEARSGFVKATRRMCKMLSDVTKDGYVFRTDLRLRPDPSVTPVCVAMDAAERYYESLGRAWERAAHVKARPCAGDIGAGQAYLKSLDPFVWRRNLDFAAIQDAHDMRLRIRDQNRDHGPITLEGHNMKLGRGGIREIEFFTQTRQIIAGGRDRDLRLKGTVESLAVLARKGWVAPEAATVLTDNYERFRLIEHRLQMIADAQTHDLPHSPQGFDRLAALMGCDVDELRSEVLERLETVHDLMEDFFEPDRRRTQGTTPQAQPVSPLEDSPILSRWSSYPALRSERAVEIFRRLRPEILGRMDRAAKPEEALTAFDGFLAGLPAGVQIFSLFESNPHLIDLLVDIVSVSPELSRYLSRNSSVLDAVIAGDFFDPWPGKTKLLDAFNGLVGGETDYERKLDMARRWQKEWHFRIGVHLLRGLKSPQEAGAAYCDLAETCIAGLWPVVLDEFARKHGDQPGRGAVVVAMGSLGAGRLHARSDLDVIVVYDPLDVEMSDGPRPLPTRSYYARLTQALITAVTAPMAEGKLYEMDMRLRPSGKQGPLAASWPAFQTYQQNDAWTWEHMALTRARPIAGSTAVRQDFDLFRTLLLSQPRSAQDVLGDLADMRARIQAAKQVGQGWDAKLGLGRMQDIELFAQALTLVSASPVTSIQDGLLSCPAILDRDSAQFMIDTYDLLWSLQIAGRLICDDVTDPNEVGTGARAFMLRATDAKTVQDLAIRLAASSDAAADLILERLPVKKGGAT